MGCTESVEDKYFNKFPNVTDRYGFVSKLHDPDPKKIAPAGAPIPGAFKILSIGINYHGTNKELKGCAIDCHNHMKMLSRRGFNPSNGFQVLTDDGRGTAYPTRENILSAISWLIDGATPGDSMYLHFSGHGTVLEGGIDALVPCDFQHSGFVASTEIMSIVTTLPQGSRLVVISDVCHHGGVLDLPWRCVLKKHSYHWHQAQGARDMMNGQLIMIRAVSEMQSSKDVAGCGALSHSFIDAMEQPNVTPEQLTLDKLMRSLFKNLRTRLGKNSLIPELSTSHRFDLTEQFAFGCTGKDKHFEHTALHSPMTMTRRYFVGQQIISYFYDGWYPGKIRRVNVDGSYDIDWEDGTTSLRISEDAIKLPEGEAAESAPNEQQPHQPSAVAATQTVHKPSQNAALHSDEDTFPAPPTPPAGGGYQNRF
eukprot:TRINITY_DN14850_c0_g1_i1.p1 TRINITY_DN14850_c0_g1~~TRINITY_DN14850_c0_g1_i1.p1  ORF type:complete len:436 (+),score=71.71 TRINITY_DN14850_c0_g1_i1:41-1309(+)